MEEELKHGEVKWLGVEELGLDPGILISAPFYSLNKAGLSGVRIVDYLREILLYLEGF